MEVCEAIRFPLSKDKTFFGETCMVFLGLLLDSENRLVCVPSDKINKGY